MPSDAPTEVIVVGAGFGGLGAALALAEAGAKVTVCEALRYPGGCASTFTRSGWTFEAGATLFAGFDPGQLFARLVERHQLNVETRALDPVVELRAPAVRLPVPARREAWIESLAGQPGAPAAAVRRFFTRQRQAADALLSLLDDERLLPPFDATALLRHIARSPRYLPLVPLVGRSLATVLARDGVDASLPLRLFCDAVCQITVQTSAAEAEAAVALSTLDYFFRGARHVVGGIGELAWALCRAVERLGGEIRFSDAVRAIRPARDGGWQVDTRRGRLVARAVVLDLLPQDALALLDDAPAAARARRQVAPLVAGVERGWGACMLYLGLDAGAPLPDGAHHLQLVGDASRPLTDGNHVFCSISARDERRGPIAGQRSVTCSTHVRLPPPGEEPEAIAAVQARMRETLAARAPELAGAVRFALTASPRTFARFVRRHRGYVGGIPRRAGLDNYRRLTPPALADGVWLVGDTIFPGQSTLAAALGGTKAAAAVLAHLGRVTRR